MKVTVISAVNDDVVLRQCLLASPDIHQVDETILQRGYTSASSAYNAAIASARNEVIIVVHQDVYLPSGWFLWLQAALDKLTQSDPTWGVLGVYSITPDGRYHGHVYCNACQSILGRPFSNPTEVASLDEVVLIVRKSSGLMFDPAMKGFHFYAADLCLTARKHGLKVYAIPCFCFHNANEYGMFPGSSGSGTSSYAGNGKTCFLCRPPVSKSNPRCCQF